jgi:hypothetical protein
MLGWNVTIYQHITNSTTNNITSKNIAQWETSVFGLSWLDELVKKEKAECLSEYDYPRQYSITAGVLLSAIKSGLPSNQSPLVIGEDYITPKGWSGELEIDLKKLADLPSDETLYIKAWDLS